MQLLQGCEVLLASQCVTMKMHTLFLQKRLLLAYLLCLTLRTRTACIS